MPGGALSTKKSLHTCTLELIALPPSLPPHLQSIRSPLRAPRAPPPPPPSPCLPQAWGPIFQSPLKSTSAAPHHLLCGPWLRPSGPQAGPAVQASSLGSFPRGPRSAFQDPLQAAGNTLLPKPSLLGWKTSHGLAPLRGEALIP